MLSDCIPADLDEYASESNEHSPSTLLTTSLDHNLTLKEDSNHGNKKNLELETEWWDDTPPENRHIAPMESPFASMYSNDYPYDKSGLREYGPSLQDSSLQLHKFDNIFSDTHDVPEDITSEENVPAGVCGLRNLGNTCFMAAGLQCLTATPPVLQHFLDMQEQDEKLPPSGTLMANFSSLLSKMWSGKYNVLQPTEFKKTLGAYHSQFKDYRQHDCQEFLALLLDTLHEQMNLAKSNKSCFVPTITAPTASTTNFTQNGQTDNCVPAQLTVSNLEEFYMSIDRDGDGLSPQGPNSPNDTMAGSPRDCSIEDLNSAVNSLHSSPLNEDEETQDSDEIVDTKSSFIHNDMCSNEEVNSSCLHKYEDIVKDAKTSNANFLVTPQECNNEIHLNSPKYPKETRRKPISVFENTNLTENHDFENKNTSVKRIKEVNCQRSNSSQDGTMSSSSDTEYDSGLEKCNVKRMRLEDKEKNKKKENLDESGFQSLQNYENGAIASEDEMEADKHWSKHLLANRSVIVDTFQGQFKSTVVCEACKHISVTYEPFMYLSVPLPHAMEKQLVINYIPANDEVPIKCVITLNKQARVGTVKEELLKTLGKEEVPVSSIALAEELGFHISKILEDNQYIKDINDNNRGIYAFELNEPPQSWVENDSDPLDSEPSTSGESSSKTPSNGVGFEEQNCIVCLEESEGGLKKHCEDKCKLVICDSCIENYFKSGKEPTSCPDCKAQTTADSFVKIVPRARPTIRIFNIPLVMRHDTDEVTNNRKGTRLFGYPHLLKLPSRVDAKDVLDIVRRIVPQDVKYTLHLVDPQGQRCSRCLYTEHCAGCSIPESGLLSLRQGDNLAVRYIDSDIFNKIKQPVDHISNEKLRSRDPLSLYDCLQAFSQSETLDEHNPWYCPKCERNQCATKTLTVHRYPKFLIVYLKRFVFYECLSMKLDDRVTFPVVGLSCGKHLYDLYACVCHFGGVSAGHYTAYAKNPQTDVWHYYNDDVTMKKSPQDDDFSNAYILFYSRQGANAKLCNI